ncbi:MAG: hypothetical protein ACLPYW_09075, partial [Acidimicrobiales bacterium]
MRRRLTVALVTLVAAALLVAGAGALLVTRQTARTQATTQLLNQGEVFAHAANGVRTRLVLDVVGKMLHFEDSEIVVIGPGGAVLTPLRGGLDAADLHPGALLAGETVSGWYGSLAFAAVPITLNP